MYYYRYLTLVDITTDTSGWLMYYYRYQCWLTYCYRYLMLADVLLVT